MALVAQRRQERVQEIAMGKMALDDLKTRLQRPPCGGAECFDGAQQVRLVHFTGRLPAIVERHRARTEQRPFAIPIERSVAFPGPETRTLAPAMGELNAGDCPMLTHEVDQPSQSCDVIVGPDTEILR